jgi:peroxiredoxin
MFPSERSLVKKLANEPFALIGVNSDRDRNALKAVIEKENITWRSFWNGGSTNGPISSAWNITGWPTIYVIDAEGVIRYKTVGAKEAETMQAIQECLDRMKAKSR